MIWRAVCAISVIALLVLMAGERARDMAPAIAQSLPPTPTPVMPMQYQRPSIASLGDLDPNKPRYEQLSWLWARREWWHAFDPSLAWEKKTKWGTYNGESQIREARLVAQGAGDWTFIRSSEDAFWTASNLDWDRIVVFRAELTWNTYGYFVARSTFGKAHYDNQGPLVDKGIGFESWLTNTMNPGLYGVAHDGTTYHRLYLGVGTGSGVTHSIMAISYPDGYVEFLVDDEWRGCIAPATVACNADPKLTGSGPLGSPNNGGVYGRVAMQHEIEAFDSGQVQYVVHNTRVFVDQRTWQ